MVLILSVVMKTLIGYEVLNKKRNVLLEKKYNTSKAYVEKIRKEHDEAFEIVKSIEVQATVETTLKANWFGVFKQFIIQQNQCAITPILTKTLVLIDATGSMTNMLDSTKRMIQTTFEKARADLQNVNIDINTFVVQVAVY